MFGTNKKNETTQDTTTNAGSKGNSLSLNTLVAGTVVAGTIIAESDIRIDGSIKGTLECNAKVIIGTTGYVDGEIRCVNAVIEGKFDGILTVKEILSLKETAVINGEASYDKLIVQQGAILNAIIRKGNASVGNGTPDSLKTAKEIVKLTNGKADEKLVLK